MLYNINWYNDTLVILTMQMVSIFFSLLPHILVHKDHDFKLMCDYVSVWPDVHLSPKVNLNHILNFEKKGLK